MEIIKKINDFYFRSAGEHYSTEYQQLRNLLDDNDIRVKNLSLKPYFITPDKRDEFSKVTEILLNVFEKLTAACFNNNEIRNILSINGRIKDYLGINPGYSGKIQVARLDGFYNMQEDSLKFLEINPDNPSYHGINDLFINSFDQLPSLKYLRKEYNVQSELLIDPLYKMLIKKYKEYCLYYKKREQEDPHIAVVCSRNSFIRNDVNIIVKYFKEKNQNVSYADPRDFTYDGEVLRLNGKKADIVYRDTLKDFFRTESSGKIHSRIRNKILNYTRYACLHNRYINYSLKKGYFGHAEDIIKAYSDNNICIINPFSSGLCAQKLSFAVIQDERFKAFFNEEELDTIERYIPWTRILGKYKTLYYNKQIDIVNFVKLNRQKFVLKPNKGYGGKGIIIGSEIEQKDWESKINTIIETGLSYTVQEYINIPSETFPLYSNGNYQGLSPLYFNLNFWGIDGKFAGGYVRASDKKIINVTQGGILVPLYYVN